MQGCLRIVNLQLGTFFHHVVAYLNCRGLSWVVGVFLEGGSEYAHCLLFEVVVEGLIDSEEESLLPVLVHLNHSVPVVGYLSQTLHFCEVDQC